MTAHEFKFDQRELKALLMQSQKAAAGNDISVTVCGIKDDEDKIEFYLCALAHNAQNEVDTVIRPLVGCPYPPPWTATSGLKIIPHSELVSLPKFRVAAAALQNLLAQNLHASPDNDKMVSAILGADTSGITGNLETIVTFQMKDASGADIAGASIIAR